MTCYMAEPSSREGEHPKSKKMATVFDYNQNLVISTAGAQRQDGLTD